MWRNFFTQKNRSIQTAVVFIKLKKEKESQYIMLEEQQEKLQTNMEM